MAGAAGPRRTAAAGDPAHPGARRGRDDGPGQPRPPAATVTFTVPNSTSQECAVDGGAWAACSSPLTLTGLSDGPHQVEIRGTNEAGPGPSTAITWRVDTTAPDLTILNGPAALTNTTSATVRFATADPSAAITCSLDGASPASCTDAWTGTVSPDAHTLEVIATDGVGNWTSRTHSWTVDTTAPSLTVAGGPSGTFAWTGDPSLHWKCSVTASGTGSDATCSSPYIVTVPMAGQSYKFTVKGKDDLGNTIEEISYTWLVDPSAQ